MTGTSPESHNLYGWVARAEPRHIVDLIRSLEDRVDELINENARLAEIVDLANIGELDA